MELFSCMHPKRVYNKYIDEYVTVSCGKCEACKKRRASKWVLRLEKERQNSQFCFFCTLTYDELHLPRLTFDPFDSSMLWDSSAFRSEHSIPLSELQFSSTADRQYFDDRMAQGGIPYASVEDLQKFHKRLNKYFHDKVTSRYSNFRYFAVSEYGSTTLRPHIHQIYFVSDQSVANNFEKAILSCWEYGRIDCQSVQKSANSYVAQYLNELFDLPSFYSHKSLRPFFVCSKRPPIGGDFYDEAEFEDIFQGCLVTQPKRVFSSSTSLDDVPLLPCIENRLFPKCKAFGRISHSCRVALYGLACQKFTFPAFKGYIYDLIVNFRRFVYDGHQYVSYQLSPTFHNEFIIYLRDLCDGFSVKGINALRRLYYLSRRVISNCLRFVCSVDYYVRHVEEYWCKKEFQLLSQFFRMQSHHDNPEELVYCYPEFAYQHRDIVLPLKECPTYQRFCADSRFAYEKVTKTHFKNAYFQSLEDANNPLYQILLTYYYAKKCNEVVETNRRSCP